MLTMPLGRNLEHSLTLLNGSRFVWAGTMLVLTIRILRSGHKEVELMEA